MAFALGGCSGGGGGGDGQPPAIVAVAFVGSSGTPAANDTMVLTFNESVSATTGRTVDDGDFALSGGATLGSGTIVLDQPTAQSVRLTLGTGVAFTPDTTTMDFAATNDVVADASGNFGRATAAVVISTSDHIAPTISSVTLDAIDSVLNGTGPAGGTLQVPQNGFTLDVRYADTGTPTALGVDATKTRITATVGVNSTGGFLAAGADLRPALTLTSSSSTAATWLVPATTVFGTGAVTLTVTVFDAGGLTSTPATFAFTVHAWTDTLRPFETSTNSQQVWYLDLARDIESFTTSPFGTGAVVNIVAGANGTPDYRDILAILGLQSASPTTVGGQSSNTVVLDRFHAAILANLATLYQGCNVSFTFTQPSGSFGSSSSVAYASLGFSQICIGGSDDDTNFDILGIAQLDPSNQRQNNDCLLESASTARLGIFLHTIADVGLSSGSSSTFRQEFKEFAPSLQRASPPVGTGTPIGQLTGDDQRLATPPTINDTRTGLIDTAIADLARFVAVIIAHECGHSMGLVVNGAMPTGLYGGDATHFPNSTSGHISTRSLFPSTAINVMSPELDYDLALDAATGFNSLNLAYLREQAFYGN